LNIIALIVAISFSSNSIASAQNTNSAFRKQIFDELNDILGIYYDPDIDRNDSIRIRALSIFGDYNEFHSFEALHFLNKMIDSTKNIKEILPSIESIGEMGYIDSKFALRALEKCYKFNDREIDYSILYALRGMSSEIEYDVDFDYILKAMSRGNYRTKKYCICELLPTLLCKREFPDGIIELYKPILSESFLKGDTAREAMRHLLKMGDNGLLLLLDLSMSNDAEIQINALSVLEEAGASAKKHLDKLLMLYDVSKGDVKLKVIECLSYIDPDSVQFIARLNRFLENCESIELPYVARALIRSKVDIAMRLRNKMLAENYNDENVYKPLILGLIYFGNEDPSCIQILDKLSKSKSEDTRILSSCALLNITGNEKYLKPFLSGLKSCSSLNYRLTLDMIFECPKARKDALEDLLELLSFKDWRFSVQAAGAIMKYKKSEVIQILPSLWNIVDSNNGDANKLALSIISWAAPNMELLKKLLEMEREDPDICLVTYINNMNIRDAEAIKYLMEKCLLDGDCYTRDKARAALRSILGNDFDIVVTKDCMKDIINKNKSKYIVLFNDIIRTYFK